MNRRMGKTVITFEEFQRTTVRTRRKSGIAWCERCEAETVMLTPREAATILTTTTLEILRRVGCGELHLISENDRMTHICEDSLQTKVKRAANGDRESGELL
ncbi:MAG: hypothetical protein ACRD6X_12545 [Pyrinomonadaceae bacterium]